MNIIFNTLTNRFDGIQKRLYSYYNMTGAAEKTKRRDRCKKSNNNNDK